MRALAALLTALAITFPSIAKSEILSSDDQIRQALVGNTITGEENGESYTEFLHPDGRITGKDRQGSYTGHWQILSGQMCMRYSKGNVSGQETNWDCAQVERDGSRIIWLGDGEMSFSNLIPGNPNKF